MRRVEVLSNHGEVLERFPSRGRFHGDSDVRDERRHHMPQGTDHPAPELARKIWIDHAPHDETAERFEEIS